MTKILFLDDDEERHIAFKKKLERAGHNVNQMINDGELHFVWDAPSCINKFKENKYDEVHLDHDLGMQFYVDVNLENTGSAVCRFIAQELAPEHYPKKAIIHSWNHYGALNMQSLLQSVKIPVVLQRFSYK